MLVARPSIDTCDFQLTLPTTVACQMKDDQGASAIESVPPPYWILDQDQWIKSSFDIETVMLQWQWKGCAFVLPQSPTADFLWL